MPTINKVIVDGVEVINLDNDTLSSASQLLSGVTAHSNTGEIITGELEPPTGDISITENGSYNIAAYETATVNVSGEIPSNLEYGVDYPLSSGLCTHYHLNEEAVGIANNAFACQSSDPYPGIAKNITTYDNLDKKTSIGDRAFYHCTGLTGEISLPQATSIGEYAFRYCTGLTGELSLPQATSIGSGAFQYCSGLTGELSLPQVTSIGNYAFESCRGLTGELSLPQVTSIGNYAFQYCSGLTGELSLPQAISLGIAAFSGCRGFTGELSLPQAISLGSYVFQNCTGLTGELSLPQAISLGSSVFFACTGLTSASLPQATSIGVSAFSSCTGLTSISLPQATTIGGRAFADCTNLTSITIKNGVNIVPASSSTNTYKIATFNNHLYWQSGTATNKIYISNATAGSPTTTLIGTLTTSNPSFTYTDGPYTITFARTGTDDDFSISWTETP